MLSRATRGWRVLEASVRECTYFNRTFSTQRPKNEFESFSDPLPNNSAVKSDRKKATWARWSQEENRKLFEMYKRGSSVEYIARNVPGRSHDAIHKKLRILRLSSDSTSFESAFPGRAVITPWTAEEKQRLAELDSAGASLDEMVREFPHRTAGSVGRARSFSRQNFVDASTARSPWTHDELQSLREMKANNCPVREIAVALRRSGRAVDAKATQLGLNTGTEWYTLEEDKRLLEAHKEGHAVVKIAKMLGRNPRGVRRRLGVLQQLKLRDSEWWKDHAGRVVMSDDDMDEIVRLRKDGLSFADIQARRFPMLPASTLKVAVRRSAAGDKPLGMAESDFWGRRTGIYADNVVGEAQELRRQGFTWPAIAKLQSAALGKTVHWQALQSFVRRAIERRSDKAAGFRAMQPLSPDELRDIQKMRDDGSTWTTIINHLALECHPTSLRARFNSDMKRRDGQETTTSSR